MSDIRFYHLTATPLDRALPQLLEKALATGMRVVVKAADAEAVAVLNTKLWTYQPNSFLPHGSAADGNAPEQPIYLSEKEEIPNGATLMAITDGSRPADPALYERVIDLFDGGDETALQSARARWKSYKEAGYELQYWQQTDTGGWAQKA